MDKSLLALVDLYQEMMEELEREMEDLGGYIKDFSPDDFSINVVVDPKLQTYAEEFIADLMTRYTNRRNKILNDDVFIGLKMLLFQQEFNKDNDDL